MTVADRYTSDQYAAAHPDWHVADSRWKATQILRMLGKETVGEICEVGCGAGEILRQLHDQLPTTRRLVGYDIAEFALALAANRATDRLSFKLKDAADDEEVFDLMLLIDVIEHVPDPIAFLGKLGFKAKRAILHVPLDLSVQSIVRPGKLLSVRNGSGHIHYFTPETAIATIEDAGYTIRDYTYTRGFDVSPESLKARVARLPRRLLPRAVTVRLLGGYSMLIDASYGTSAGARADHNDL